MEIVNKANSKYNVAGFVEEDGKVFCHDEVIVDGMDKAVDIAKSYLRDGFIEVRITSVGDK